MRDVKDLTYDLIEARDTWSSHAMLLRCWPKSELQPAPNRICWTARGHLNRGKHCSPYERWVPAPLTFPDCPGLINRLPPRTVRVRQISGELFA